jgi:hypothetical protein
MQPPWREGELLIKVLPADAAWGPVLHGGPNGFVLIVIALSWWFHSANGNGELDEDLRSAIDDVNWVVLQLTDVGAAAPVGESKRAREEATEEETPMTKR